MCRLECLRLFGGDAVDDRVDGGGVVGVVERSAAIGYGLLVCVSGVGVPRGDEESVEADSAVSGDVDSLLQAVDRFADHLVVGSKDDGARTVGLLGVEAESTRCQAIANQ